MASGVLKDFTSRGLMSGLLIVLLLLGCRSRSGST